MKRSVLLLFASIFASLSYSQRIDSVKIHSEILGIERKLLVYTPRDYDKNLNSKFEVIYVFDAQAREYFDCVQSTLAFLNNFQFPMIVVGIVSNERNKDFLPKNDYPETFKHYNGYLGNAENFLKFISYELIPYIDTNYRTLPKRIAVAHSNGGTFLMYSFTQNPDIFDAYIAISPNWAYDNDQPVRRLEKFDNTRIQSVKYIYMCNAREGDSWKEWVPPRKKAIDLLNKLKNRHKIIFDNQDFSSTENHITVYPVGVFNGLKKYLDYQYFDADNLISYYSDLNTRKIITFTPDQLNQVAYDFYFSGRLEGALKILLWANQLFPENLNLYDSIGEMYEHKNDKSEALKYYMIFNKKLEQKRNLFTEDEYNSLKKASEDRIKNLESNK
jgi:predicted alpha/beta superfamily hydrolase